MAAFFAYLHFSDPATHEHRPQGVREFMAKDVRSEGARQQEEYDDPYQKPEGDGPACPSRVEVRFNRGVVKLIRRQRKRPDERPQRNSHQHFCKLPHGRLSYPIARVEIKYGNLIGAILYAIDE